MIPMLVREGALVVLAQRVESRNGLVVGISPCFTKVKFSEPRTTVGWFFFFSPLSHKVRISFFGLILSLFYFSLVGGVESFCLRCELINADRRPTKTLTCFHLMTFDDMGIQFYRLVQIEIALPNNGTKIPI